MPPMRFLLFPIRSNKQGVQINVGKDGDEYNAIVNTMQAHPDDISVLPAKYLNRLSDLLFILGRVANPEGDILWRPGAAGQSETDGEATIDGPAR